MAERKGFLDSQSDQFQPSQQIHSNKHNQDDQSSSDIHNDDSQHAQQQSDRSFDEDEDDENQKDITKQQVLQRQILKTISMNEQKRKPFQRQIIGEIFDKVKSYQDAARGKQGEQLVTLRIQQLVYNKLLVLTYGYSQFRLILAHFHLGHAYLKHDCMDQTIQHITIALHKNQKLFDEVPKTKLFHSVMENILAECLIKKQEYDDAISALQKSIQLISDEDPQAKQIINRAKILQAQCYCKLKQYSQAIRIVEEVVATTEKQQKLQYYAFALVEKATILATVGDFQNAITAQDQAINILIKQNYPKPQEVAEMYAKLGQYFQQMGNTESSLSCIQKVKTLYEQIYSKDDKRVIKARRKIATSLLKNDRFKQAVNELLQIIELQQKIFGQSSIQTARTLKLLGTVYIKLQGGDARTYLKRAMNIFNAHGNKKQVEQIKQKLRLLTLSNNNNNDLKIISEQDL